MRIKWVPNKNINKTRVATLLQSSITLGQFTNYGPNVQLLEKIIRFNFKVAETKAVICVTNGSAALHAAVSGINIYNASDDNLCWATQSFTFPASTQNVLATAQIIDIDEEGGLDLEKVDSTMVDGIIVTNVFGNVVDIDKYTSWCDKNNKLLLFDNAATPYTFYKGSNAINYGTGSIISFHHTKPLGFGEGGAVIIDQKYEYDIRRCINFGINNNSASPKWHPQGSNYKMSDIAAIYIIQHLDKFMLIIKKHQQLYEKFINLIRACADICLFPNHSDQTPFVSCFCLLSPRFTVSKVAELQKKGIYCRKYYDPLVQTKISCELYDKILCLPCTVDMTSDDLIFIVNSLL